MEQGSYQTIKIDSKDRVLNLSLNRPERLDAFNLQMLKELREALDHSADDEQTREIFYVFKTRCSHY